MKVKNPVFIIGCPRSGTTLLYTILRSSPELWSSPDEAHYIWKKFLPEKRDPMFSVYLTSEDYQEGDSEYIESKYAEYVFGNQFLRDFVKHVFQNRFKKFTRPFFFIWRQLVKLGKNFVGDIRVMDKTPPNTYRVDFLAKAFPDAKFIYITRDGATNISSLIEGWRSTGRFNFAFRKFYDYNKELKIKGYEGDVWKFTNPPGWEEYKNKSLEEVCAFQWKSAHKYALEAFEKMDGSRWTQVKYEELIANPEKITRELAMFIDLEYAGAIKKNAENLPVVSTNTKPDPKKWLKNKDLIMNIAEDIDEMQRKLGYESLLNGSKESSLQGA